MQVALRWFHSFYHQDEVYMTAKDPAGNIGASNKVLVRVTPDAIPPTVSISAPRTGAKLVENQEFSIQASATDNIKVSDIRLFVEGQELEYDRQKGLGRATYPAPAVDSAMPITISAIAYDTAGNESAPKEVVAYIVPDAKPDIYIGKLHNLLIIFF